MRFRDVYLMNAQTLLDSDSVTINLQGGLKILYLLIQYQATGGATSNTLCRLNGLVSRLAVADGSNVIQSLSMREAQARNAFTFKRLPFQVLGESAAFVIIEQCMLDFRRYPGDVQSYLDTSMYQNLQFQDTHAFTISATAGFATGTGKLTVIARVIDSGAPSRLGVVGCKEVNSFASTASGDTNTDLPIDYPTMAVMVLDPVDANTPDNYLSNLKLTIDTDAYIPLNVSYTDLLRDNLLKYGEFEQRIDILPDTTATLLGDLYYRTRGWTGPNHATGLAKVNAVTANQMSVVQTTGGAAPEGATLKGQAPHGAVIYEFGDGFSQDQIFNPQGVAKFQLKLTGANTGATPKVVVAQFRP